MKLVLYLYTGDRSGTRGWTQCILEEVCVAPRRSRGAGAQGPVSQFLHCPKVHRGRAAD